MNCELLTVSLFDSQAKRLAKKYRSLADDIEQLKRAIRENPFMGQPLGSHLHKIRMAVTSKGGGQSGGARVITYAVEKKSEDEYIVRLISIYDKSEIDSVPVGELKKVLRANGLE